MAGSQWVHVAIVHTVVVPGLEGDVGSVGCFVHYRDWTSKYLALLKEPD